MERPDLYSEYNTSIKWKKMFCSRCNKHRWCCQHHVDGRRNSNRVVLVCSNGNPEGTVYEDACHQWIHSNPRLAEKEGYHNKLKGGYVKRPTKRSKWIIHKKISDPGKWRLNK